MDGFEQMVRSEVFRARYRAGYERGRPLLRGKPNEVVVPLQDVLHTFRKGHRIMVQVQSTWFPLVDRNPQAWTDNPLLAPDDAFVSATHRVHRSARHASRIEFTVSP
jgi:predicted acyl esterase